MRRHDARVVGLNPAGDGQFLGYRLVVGPRLWTVKRWFESIYPAKNAAAVKAV